MYWCIVVRVWVGWRLVFFFKQKTAYEMRSSDWSSDVCSSDLFRRLFFQFPTQVGNACHVPHHRDAEVEQQQDAHCHPPDGTGSRPADIGAFHPHLPKEIEIHAVATGGPPTAHRGCFPPRRTGLVDQGM